MPFLSTRIVLDCFYLLIFYSEKFSTDVCRLPYAVNVNLNLSNMTGSREASVSSVILEYQGMDITIIITCTIVEESVDWRRFHVY